MMTLCSGTPFSSRPAECDRHFSASEPSTHDSWTPRAAEEEVSTYVVSRALHQVRSKTRAFLTEGKTVGRSGERSVRKVAMALRSFVPTVLAISDDQASSQRGLQVVSAPTRTTYGSN